MNNWTKKPLIEVADFILGKMLDKAKNKGSLMPYLANFNVQWGRFDLSHLNEMRFTEDELKKFSIKFGDILMCEGGEAGRCAYWKESNSSILFQKAIHRIRVFSEVDSAYLYYYFLDFGKKNGFEPYTTGSTIKHLPREQLAKIEISYPDIKQQKFISAILLKYDDLIQTNQQRIALLEEAAQRLYDEWFVKLRFPNHEQVPVVDGVPEGWERVTLSKLVDLINGYPFKPSELGEEGYPIIKIPELRSGILATTPRNDGSQIPTKYFVNHGDIIFSWSGTILIDEWGYDKAILNQHLFNVVPYQKERKSFIRLAIQQAIPEMVGHAIGSTMMHLRRGTVDNYQLLLPSEILLSKFCMMVDNIFYQSSILKKQNQKLAQARDGLLPRLMSGKMDVSGLSLKEIA